MAEPSYYPLSSINSEGITSPSTEHHKNRPGSPHPSSPPRKFRKGALADRAPSWSAIKTPLEMAILPVVAIAYLAFCYTVHGRAVPVNTAGLFAVNPQHFATIKGGVTAISIIVISIALSPIYNMVSDLKSEEFFRTLTSHSHGVPLEAVNRISNPTFGSSDMVMAVWKHACSNHYILGIVASLLVWIVATLAPGALTINSVLADGQLMAFAVGAVPPQSVLNGTSNAQPAFSASLNSPAAASVAWAEMKLGVQYSFGVANTSEPDYAAYIVPVPLGLSTTTSARWLSDVIGVNPMCSWPSTNLTAVQLPFNSTSYSGATIATAYLSDFNLDIQISSLDLSASENRAVATVKDPMSSVLNHTTQGPASDGSTVFLLSNCESGCKPGGAVDVTLDLSAVPSRFTIALTDQTWTSAILTCLPNVAIETREVRNDGHGVLMVQPRPTGRALTRQGNLNPVQTTALFSIATMSLSQSAGALTGTTQGQYFTLGSQVQGDLLFGKEVFDSLPGLGAPTGTTVTIAPASILSITAGYTRCIQSAAKSYLAGQLGSAHVPGRISGLEIVFAASIPNIAVATVVFALLTAIMVLAHFRRGKGVEFTLVNVAAAVHESELPALFARAGIPGGGGQGQGQAHPEEGYTAETADGILAKGSDSVPDTGEGILEALGERRVFMQRRTDGSPVLHIG